MRFIVDGSNIVECVRWLSRTNPLDCNERLPSGSDGNALSKWFHPVSIASCLKDVTKMKFSRELDPFLRVFYVCGMSCYPSADAFSIRKSRNRRFVRYIPSVGFVAVSAMLAVIAYVYRNSDNPNSNCRLNLGIIFTKVTVAMITVITCATRSIFRSEDFAEIWSHIGAIERLAWRQLTYDSKEFKRFFLRKCVLTVLVFMFPRPFSFCFRDRLLLLFSLDAIKAFVLLILIQPLFYIDLLDYMLKCFVRHIDAQATNAVMIATVEAITIHDLTLHQLKICIGQYKQVHLHLWSISQKINQLFGWIIVVVLMQYFVSAISNMAWVFKLLFVKTSMTESTRKLCQHSESSISLICDLSRSCGDRIDKSRDNDDRLLECLSSM